MRFVDALNKSRSQCAGTAVDMGSIVQIYLNCGGA